jgi:hypothetical protein
MALKVVHINRKELSHEAQVRSFWEDVLKPKWEKRARERGETFKMELQSHGKPSPGGFVTKQETLKSGEKLKIVIEINGNNLNIKCNRKKR